MKNIIKNSHFIGYKIRQLRKSLGLTLEDLSVRCIQMNANTAPSVSYLILIETGHRKPSEGLIIMLADIFQKDINWFLDETIKIEEENNPVGFSLEPKFLFSKELLFIMRYLHISIEVMKVITVNSICRNIINTNICCS